jgi:hypothetical protein
MSTFNEILQSIAAEPLKTPNRQQWIQFFSFNGNGIREQIPLQQVSTLVQLNEENYRPDSMTPLFDAIGHATGKLRYALEKEQDYAVLVTILTDGAENASREFTAVTISNIIKELKQQNWTFTYLGTNQDVAKEATRMNVGDHMAFTFKSLTNYAVLNKELSARRRYYDRLDKQDGSAQNQPYFDPEDQDQPGTK